MSDLMTMLIQQLLAEVEQVEPLKRGSLTKSVRRLQTAVDELRSAGVHVDIAAIRQADDLPDPSEQADPLPLVPEPEPTIGGESWQ